MICFILSAANFSFILGLNYALSLFPAFFNLELSLIIY